ncbi:MAG TPA: hypothetical protein VFH66_13945 [Mycobacteriales bacterium]|nr:hypothetical protein [Mycobacteriales bacterium]
MLLVTAISVAAAAGIAVAAPGANSRPASLPSTTPPVATTQGPAYLVGAATEDITPSYGVNLGGFGLGDGSFFPEALVGRGGTWDGSNPSGQPRIRSRAVVFDDGTNAVAIADIETQGMFAAYEDGPYGLHDMAEQVAKDIPGLPVDHIVIASDHTHHGPDTIGAWGGVPDDYLKLVFDRTVQAIEQAYQTRVPTNVYAGQSDASDLIYNQSCTEALNQDKQPAYTGPDVCATPGKDGMMRVVQARTPDGTNVVTLVVYAAHSTTNMGTPLDGDWPQFLGDWMATHYGGVGIGMEGANGGTQPCRPTCSFTSPNEPGYNMTNRYDAIIANYSSHVADALAHAQLVTGPVAASQRYIREAITGPFVNALFLGGIHVGAKLMRSHESPWMVGQTVRTVAADVRVGSLLFNATPGEGFPSIRQGVQDAVTGPSMVIQLGLANDQLGYLIAPARYVPIIAAEAAVNDNIIFNVSPTIGDHVMCSDISLAKDLGADWTVNEPPTCAPYDAQDAATPAADAVPVGGVTAP